MLKTDSVRLFTQAIQYQKQGLNDLALRSCNQILQTDPNFTDAHIMQGVIWAQRCNYDQAAIHFEAVTQIHADHLGAHYNLGLMRYNAGHIGQATHSYEYVLARNPDHIGSLNGLGVILASDFRFEEAIRCFSKSLSLNPDQAETLNNLGNCFQEIRKWANALDSYKKALALDPKSKDVRFNIAKMYSQIGQASEAIEAYENLLQIDSGFEPARVNLAKIWLDQQQYARALEVLSESLPAGNNNSELWFSIGFAHENLDRVELALDAYTRAIELNNNHFRARVHRAECLNRLGKFQNAISDLKEALRSEEKELLISAWATLALVYQDSGQNDLAAEAYQSIRLIDEKCQPKHVFNQGLWELYSKEFQLGWRHYQARRELIEGNYANFISNTPVWNEDQPVGRVLLLAEQGIGDEIFFTKGLGLYAERFGPPTCITADRRLLAIFQRAFPDLTFHDRSLLSELRPSDFDMQLSLGDLGSLLSLDPTQMPRLRMPHLISNPDRTELLAALESKGRRQRIGLSWKSKNEKLGASKSLPLIEMMRTLGRLDVDWVNLQYGEVNAEIEQVQSDLGIHINQIKGVDTTQDLDGLLSLIRDCDFIVTTSNSTAHLCGALGKPGVVLVPFGKSKLWYWHAENGPSIWYPSLHVLHSKQPGDLAYLLELTLRQIQTVLL